MFLYVFLPGTFPGAAGRSLCQGPFLYGQVAFLWRTTLGHPVARNGHEGRCSRPRQLLAVVNSAATTGCAKCLSDYLFSVLPHGWMPMSGTAGAQGDAMLNCLRNLSTVFPKLLCRSMFTPAMQEGSSFPVCTNTYFHFLKNKGHSGKWEAVSPYGFEFHVPRD